MLARKVSKDCTPYVRGDAILTLGQQGCSTRRASACVCLGAVRLEKTGFTARERKNKIRPNFVPIRSAGYAPTHIVGDHWGRTRGTDYDHQHRERARQASYSMANTIKTSIDDLDSAIRSLEISTNPKLRRACNCQAARHPLLAAAPNCLSCGKSWSQPRRERDRAVAAGRRRRLIGAQ